MITHHRHFHFATGSVAYCDVGYYASVDKDEPVRIIRTREYIGSNQENRGRLVIDVAHLKHRRYQYSSYFAQNFRRRNPGDVAYAGQMFHDHPYKHLRDEENRLECEGTKAVTRADPMEAADAVALIREQDIRTVMANSKLHVAYRMPSDATPADIVPLMKRTGLMTLANDNHSKLTALVDKRIRKYPKERWVILSAHTVAYQSEPPVIFGSL